MKKIALLAGVVAMVAMTSCKKEWTCTCTTTDSSGLIPDVSASTTIKDTKKNAKETCESGSASVGTLSTSCSID